MSEERELPVGRLARLSRIARVGARSGLSLLGRGDGSEAAAQQVLARAQGDAAAFDKVYEQYKLAPEVTRRRMYYETMERVLRQTDKTVVEAPGVTPYLPLPEVRRTRQEQPSITVERP